MSGRGSGCGAVRGKAVDRVGGEAGQQMQRQGSRWRGRAADGETGQQMERQGSRWRGRAADGVALWHLGASMLMVDTSSPSRTGCSCHKFVSGDVDVDSK